MRFLYGLLAVFWLMFGWVCVQSMQWKPPYPTPIHAAEELRDTNLEKINERIEGAKMIIANSEFSEFNPEDVHYWLGWLYWLKAFLQDSRRTQEAYLQFAMEECNKALELSPDHYRYITLKADITMVQGDLDKAEELYGKALENARSRDARRMLWHRLRYLSEYRGEADASNAAEE